MMGTIIQCGTGRGKARHYIGFYCRVSHIGNKYSILLNYQRLSEMTLALGDLNACLEESQPDVPTRTTSTASIP